MATKSSGSLGDDPAKSSGALEKDPTAGVDAGDAGSGHEAGPSYDYSDSSSSGGGYDPPSDSGGGTGGSGTTEDDAADPGDTGDAGDGEAEAPGGDNSEGDPGDDSGDTGGEDGAGAPGDDDLELLPGEPPGENPADPPGGRNRVSIDIDLMRVLIASMERARDQIPDLEQELRTILTDLDLEPSVVSGFDRVTSWIEEELPGLRRRLAMAEAIEDGFLPVRPSPTPVPLPTPEPTPVPLPTPGPRLPVDLQPLPGRRTVTWEGETFPAVAPHEAAEHGRRAATLIESGDGSGVTAAAELIQEHQHDPYFAREFASNTDPSFIAELITEGGEGADTDLRALVTATVGTANRATGELAPETATREAWEAALA